MRIRMGSGTKTIFRMLSHGKGTDTTIERRLPVGTEVVKFDKLKAEVTLDYRLAKRDPVTGKTIFYIDEDRGVNVGYNGLTQDWKGIDGKYTFHTQVKKDMEDIQTAKAGDVFKWVKIGVIMTIVNIAGLVMAVLFLASGKANI